MSAEDFYALSKALKAAGRTELRKELNKGLRDATKPLIKKTRAATDRLPQSGGLAAIVRKEPQRVQVRTGAATAGVRIVVGKRRGAARAADQGVIRHPVFGGGTFVSQRVAPGWFTETLENAAPDVKPDIEKAMSRVIDKIVRDA